MNPKSTVFAGKLRTGDPIVFISGKVSMSDCIWAIEMLDDLIDAGFQSISFDFVGVENVPGHWFETEVQRRHKRHNGLRINTMKPSRNDIAIEQSHSLRAKLALAFVDFKSRLMATQGVGRFASREARKM